MQRRAGDEDYFVAVGPLGLTLYQILSIILALAMLRLLLFA